MDRPADNHEDGAAAGSGVEAPPAADRKEGVADSRPEGPPADDRADEGHLPVLVGREVVTEVEAVEARPVDRAPEAALPAPLVAAAGGFLAGFLTILLARLLRGRGAGLALGSSRGRRALEREITSSRSFLVDVHVLKR